MPEMQIPRKLLPLVEKKKRFKIVIGGRGGAKSVTIGDICLMHCQTQGIKIGCFREFQSSIADSVHSLLKDEIERLEIPGYRVLETSISNSSGGEFRFRGLARNPDAIKSMHGFRRFWVEEAQSISKESLRLLTPTLRETDSEIWMSANPMSAADPFSERFIAPFERELERDGYYEDDLHIIIVCNYYDNPLFPPELEMERAFDEEHLSTTEYEHIWLGKFNDEVEGSIIRVEWFNACIDAHLKLGFQQLGATIAAHDPSDTGPDPKGFAVRQGSVVLDVMENATGDANDGADWACYWAMEYRADIFRWDCDGLGSALKRQISTTLDGKRIDLDMFKGSETPDMPDDIYQPTTQIDRSNSKTNKQTFRNKRAQYYAMLRDRFYQTYVAVKQGRYTDPELLIGLSSEIDCMNRLRSEVCRIPRKQNANGLFQIMRKDEMARLKPPIKSPNLADSLMMTMKGHTRNLTFQHQARPVQHQDAAGWT